jgi:hypothetical protein
MMDPAEQGVGRMGRRWELEKNRLDTREGEEKEIIDGLMQRADDTSVSRARWQLER